LWLCAILVDFRIRTKRRRVKGVHSNPQTIGEHLLKVRLEKGLLQKEVAELLNVTVSCIENGEGNKSQPQPRLLPKVIVFLGYFPDLLKNILQLKNPIFLYRVKRELSQRTFAKELGIDPSTLHEVEKNGRRPNGNTLEKLRSICPDFLPA